MYANPSSLVLRSFLLQEVSFTACTSYVVENIFIYVTYCDQASDYAYFTMSTNLRITLDLTEQPHL